MEWCPQVVRGPVDMTTGSETTWEVPPEPDNVDGFPPWTLRDGGRPQVAGGGAVVGGGAGGAVVPVTAGVVVVVTAPGTVVVGPVVVDPAVAGPVVVVVALGVVTGAPTFPMCRQVAWPVPTQGTLGPGGVRARS